MRPEALFALCAADHASFTPARPQAGPHATIQLLCGLHAAQPLATGQHPTFTQPVRQVAAAVQTKPPTACEALFSKHTAFLTLPAQFQFEVTFLAMMQDQRGQVALSA